MCFLRGRIDKIGKHIHIIVPIYLGGICVVAFWFGHEDLRDVVMAMDLSRYAMRKIRQNLFRAFFYNGIGIPVAAG